jgi:AcrR family transcriptional regulator
MDPQKREERRTRRRDELIEIAVRQLRTAGLDGVTSVAITAEAGMAQSAFYNYFESVEECRLLAAQFVAEQIGTTITDHRRGARRRVEETGDEEGAGGYLDHIRAVLSFFVEQPGFSELLLRYRRDPSTLGRAMAALDSRLRLGLIEDLHKWFHTDIGPQDCAELGDFIHSSLLAAGEAILDKRITDIDRLSRSLWLMIDGASENFRRVKSTERAATMAP